MWFMVAWTVKFGEHGLDNPKSMHGRWNCDKNLKKLTWAHMKNFHFYVTIKQAPFDSDKYFLRFDRKCVLHNQDEKLVSCSSMNWEKFVKTGFTQKCLSKSHFSKFLQVLLTLTNFLESKIIVGKQNPWIQFNPHTSHKIAQAFTLTLLLSISRAQLRKWGLRGRKWGFI